MSKKLKKVLIAGATSLIAQETARQLARRKASEFYLLGRDEAKLTMLSDDLKARGASSVAFKACNLANEDSHDQLIEAAYQQLGSLDLVLLAWGDLGNENQAQLDYEMALKIFSVNFLSMVSFLTKISSRLEQSAHCSLAVISSVAGDRGRRSNYVYGSSKAAISTYLQGLRARLASKGIHVLTIKPGPIDTPMTAHMKRGLLTSSASLAGKIIYSGINSGCEVIYVPGYWRIIMWIICAIPERIFKRLKI